MIKKLFEIFKPMRVVLITLALLTLVFKTPFEVEISYEGWQMVRTLLMPVMAPLFFMVLLLDSLIASIWFTQTQDAERTRYKIILIVNLLTAGLLALVWIPYFLAVLR